MTEIRSFFDWFPKWSAIRPWLLIGQGPSFSRHVELQGLREKYMTLGLNRVARAFPVYLTHVIDVGVFQDVPDLDRYTNFLVMPWHPHVEWRPARGTLEDFALSTPAILTAAREGRLLWYNLSSWTGPARDWSPVVKVSYFSSEAALRLLALAGVQTVRTLGIDGGTDIATEFRSVAKPLKGGHSTYSLQDPKLREIVSEYGLDYGPVG